VGETVEREEVFGTIEAVKTVSDLFMPVGGEILEKNPAIEETPDVVNKDPYGKGWLVKIRMTDKSEVNDLLSADDYSAMIG
jgi:glycine cleavage system H protein